MPKDKQTKRGTSRGGDERWLGPEWEGELFTVWFFTSYEYETIWLYFSFFFIFFKFYWRVVDLPCDNFCCTKNWFSYIHIYVYFFKTKFKSVNKCHRTACMTCYNFYKEIKSWCYIYTISHVDTIIYIQLETGIIYRQPSINLCLYIIHYICYGAINSYLWKNTQESEGCFPLDLRTGLTGIWKLHSEAARVRGRTTFSLYFL